MTSWSFEKGGATLLCTDASYLQYGSHATNLISQLSYRLSGGDTDRETYRYDADGRVCAIRENGRLKVKYTYDALGRLVREDNRELALTTTFEYDCGGNLLRQNEYPYSLADADALTGGVEVSYTYGDRENPDRLTAFDGQAIVYNAGGCPTSYLGHSCTYTQGTLLASYDSHTFSYDADGLRVQKDGISYFYTDGVLRSQTEGDQTMVFSYGTQGMTGFSYGDATYFYRRNLFGDVTHIYTTEGVLCAKYLYDAWGNHKVVDAAGAEILDSDHIGNVNPIRYRGYYYDSETGLYYLQARYYDPKTGRFLSQDHISYLDPEHLTGLNLFAYCKNNPVMYADPSGHLAFFILTAIIGAAIGLGITAAVDYIPDKTFDLHWGWYVGAGVLGAVIGAGIGMAVSYYATGSIASSTGKVFSGLFGKTTLYRSVGSDELVDIQKTGRFNLGKGMESKQFGLSLDETKLFGSHKLINQPNIVSAKIPNRVFFRLDFTPVDIGIFKSGVVTVRSSMMNMFNKYLLSIMFL